MTANTSKTLGINGLGRIGKLCLWHHAGRKYFDSIVINTGREVGQSFQDILHYIERDTTYGRLDATMDIRLNRLSLMLMKPVSLSK